MFCAAEPANAPVASYLRAVRLAASTPAAIAFSCNALVATPALSLNKTFSAASLAAMTAPRPATAAAPPVNKLGRIEGIASPTDSTIYLKPVPTSLMSL